MFQQLEKAYLQKVTSQHRRHYGQYFTPEYIAKLMQKWILTGNPGSRLLDPAVGMGKLIADLPAAAIVDAFDEDTAILSANKDFLLYNEQIHLYQQDFLISSWDEKYDGVICNPPYITFRNELEKTSYLTLFRDKMGINLSSYTNMYALFILKSLEQLDPEHGKAAFFVPSDFLNARYGTKIKDYFLQEKNLSIIANTDIQMGWFKGAATTSSLLLFDNSKRRDAIEFIRIQSDKDWSQLEKHITTKQPNPIGILRRSEELAPTKKWRELFFQEEQQRFTNVKPLNHFGTARNGIKTGSNQFFCFNQEKLDTWRINNSHFLPCISQSHQVPNPFFTYVDFKKLRSQNEAVYLLTVEEPITDLKLKHYLEDGEAHGLPQRNQIRKREIWYQYPILDPAPILVNVFNRKQIHIIRNKTNVRNLDPFIGIYLYEEYEKEADLFMAYFLSEAAQRLLANPQTEYGKDLKKLDAEDLHHSYILDITALTDEQREAILSIYQRIEYLTTHEGDQQELSQQYKQLNQYFNTLIVPAES